MKAQSASGDGAGPDGGLRAPEAVDPYADLGEDSILVRFEANAELDADQCNPNVHYALRTTEDYVFVNVNYAVGDNITGSGINLANLDDTGVATTGCRTQYVRHL